MNVLREAEGILTGKKGNVNSNITRAGSALDGRGLDKNREAGKPKKRSSPQAAGYLVIIFSPPCDGRGSRGG
jgi:hypothetical protein